MDKHAPKYANRRARLRRLIDQKADGVPAAFARMYGYDRSQIGQYLSETYKKGRSIGEGVVEKLEAKLDLPCGWFDLPDDGSAAWPFSLLDEEKVRRLTDDERTRLETAVLLSAAQLGLDVKR